MKKVFYLSSCSTCKRILKELDLPSEFVLQDIKKQPLDKEDLDVLYQSTKSYEKLFNKRAQLYKSRELKNKQLTEADYAELLLEHYTFLKRPVFIINDDIFVGNHKNTIAQVKATL
ncbi:arsenate reductase family protein [Mesonia sediminis]|uniref:Arsenate reductase family protein n=1 Tax=Mesonia sediminis TaxID=1703946 RepID=A0ABW5SFD9_9FLAO